MANIFNYGPILKSRPQAVYSSFNQNGPVYFISYWDLIWFASGTLLVTAGA